MIRFLLMSLLLLSACTHLPPIQSADSDHQERIAADCRSCFSRGRWQLVHTIHARFFSGREAFFTGVIVLSSEDASIHCVLMSQEGFVFFEAVDDGMVSVKRAFGPFDRLAFAKGVMRDIRLMFILPGGSPQNCGKFAGEAEGCRFNAGNGRIVDVVPMEKGKYRIHQYDPARMVTAEALDQRGLASKMVLKATGNTAYTLVMDLVDAVALQ